VGQGLAGATDTRSSDDPRLGAAGRALFNDDAGDGNGHCGVTNAQAKRHAAEERDGPFGFRPRHVRDRTATRAVLADSGMRESNTSFGGGHDGSELDRRDVAVIGGGLPELAEAVSSRYAESVYVRYGSDAAISYVLRNVRFTLKIGHGPAIEFASGFANEPHSTAWHGAPPARIVASAMPNQSTRLVSERHRPT
jgi:hypothetical protein